MQTDPIPNWLPAASWAFLFFFSCFSRFIVELISSECTRDCGGHLAFQNVSLYNSTLSLFLVSLRADPLPGGYFEISIPTVTGSLSINCRLIVLGLNNFCLQVRLVSAWSWTVRHPLTSTLCKCTRRLAGCHESFMTRCVHLISVFWLAVNQDEPSSIA